MQSPSRPVEEQTATRVGAFFDVDNTLIPGHAIEIRFVRFLQHRGLVGFTELARSLGYLIRHMPPVSVHPLRERKIYLEGKPRSTIEALAEEFVQRVAVPCLSIRALAVLREHQQAGHAVALVSASLDCLVAPLARRLDVPLALPARLEHASDRYTGRIVPPLPYAHGKRQLIEALARRDGLSLQQSYAYGDSPGDVHILDMVGHPTVVNPIRGMRRTARRRGWRIEEWR